MFASYALENNEEIFLIKYLQLVEYSGFPCIV